MIPPFPRVVCIEFMIGNKEFLVLAAVRNRRAEFRYNGVAFGIDDVRILQALDEEFIEQGFCFDGVP